MCPRCRRPGARDGLAHRPAAKKQWREIRGPSERIVPALKTGFTPPGEIHPPGEISGVVTEMPREGKYLSRIRSAGISMTFARRMPPAMEPEK